MEILIGILTGITVFITYYREQLKKEKKIQQLVKILKDMEAAIDHTARESIKDIKSDIKDIKQDVGDLKISIAVLKVRVGLIAGVFSTVGGTVAAIIIKLIFKT